MYLLVKVDSNYVVDVVWCADDHERRQADDGHWYTEEEFVDYYGGLSEWEKAPREI